MSKQVYEFPRTMRMVLDAVAQLNWRFNLPVNFPCWSGLHLDMFFERIEVSPIESRMVETRIEFDSETGKVHPLYTFVELRRRYDLYGRSYQRKTNELLATFWLRGERYLEVDGSMQGADDWWIDKVWFCEFELDGKNIGERTIDWQREVIAKLCK